MIREFLTSETTFEEKYLYLNGQRYNIESTGFEPTDPKYGFSVETFRFVDDSSRDLAKAVVLPRGCTPPQLVERKGSVVDIPLKGSGRFICLVPGEQEVREINFHNVSRALRNFKITYGQGLYQCWIAGANGLEFAKICEPSYQDGDLRNLNLIEDTTIPTAFSKAVLCSIYQTSV